MSLSPIATTFLPDAPPAPPVTPIGMTPSVGMTPAAASPAQTLTGSASSVSVVSLDILLQDDGPSQDPSLVPTQPWSPTPQEEEPSLRLSQREVDQVPTNSVLSEYSLSQFIAAAREAVAQEGAAVPAPQVRRLSVCSEYSDGAPGLVPSISGSRLVPIAEEVAPDAGAAVPIAEEGAPAADGEQVGIVPSLV